MCEVAAECTTWTAILDEVAHGVLDRASITGPPIDTLDVARRLKVPVAFDGAQAERGRYKRIGGRSLILLKPDERPERLQWAIAHELGEAVAHQAFERVGDNNPRRGARETVANALASRLLLPSRWFAGDVLRLAYDLLSLKSIYRTASHELIAMRFLDDSTAGVVTVFDAGRVTRRRAVWPSQPPRLHLLEKSCWNFVHTKNRPCEQRDEPLLVRGWPIHESGWKREILWTTTNDEWLDA